MFLHQFSLLALALLFHYFRVYHISTLTCFEYLTRNKPSLKLPHILLFLIWKLHFLIVFFLIFSLFSSYLLSWILFTFFSSDSPLLLNIFHPVCYPPFRTLTFLCQSWTFEAQVNLLWWALDQVPSQKLFPPVSLC